MRLVGAVCLAGGSALLGFCAVEHMKSRVRDLRRLLAGLETMLRELDYCLAPLPELLCRAAEQTDGRVKLFFELCAKGAEHLNGRTFQAVWDQAAEAAQLRLERDDLLLLEQLGTVLGRYDRNSQHRALAGAITRLEDQCGRAAEQSRQLGKVYGVLGITAGTFLLILLI